MFEPSELGATASLELLRARFYMSFFCQTNLIGIVHVIISTVLVLKLVPKIVLKFVTKGKTLINFKKENIWVLGLNCSHQSNKL